MNGSVDSDLHWSIITPLEFLRKLHHFHYQTSVQLTTVYSESFILIRCILVYSELFVFGLLEYHNYKLLMSAKTFTRKMLLMIVTLTVTLLLWTIAVTDRRVSYQTTQIKEIFVMPKLRNIARFNYSDMNEGRADTHLLPTTLFHVTRVLLNLVLRLTQPDLLSPNIKVIYSMR